MRVDYRNQFKQRTHSQWKLPLSLADMRIQSEQGLRHRQLVDELLDTGHRHVVHVLSHLPGGRSSGALGLQVRPINCVPQLTLITFANAQIQSGRPAAGEASAD